MLNYVAVVLSLLVAVSASKHLPSYIGACKRLDPELSKCSVEKARLALPSLLKGDTEFKTPVLVPWKVPQLELSSGQNLKLDLKDVSVIGLEKSIIESLPIDTKNLKGEITVSIPELIIDGQYNISGSILILPISGNGPAKMTFNDNTFTYKFEYELVKRKDGKEYMRINKSSIDITLGKAQFRLDNLFNGNKELGEHMNTFLNENSKEVVNDLGYPVVRQLTQYVVDQVFKAFLRVVPYDEILLP